MLPGIGRNAPLAHAVDGVMLLPLQAAELGAAGHWQQHRVRTVGGAMHANATEFMYEVHLLGSALPPQATSAEANVPIGFLNYTCMSCSSATTMFCQQQQCAAQCIHWILSATMCCHWF